jgi:hypothetical protein
MLTEAGGIARMASHWEGWESGEERIPVVVQLWCSVDSEAPTLAAAPGPWLLTESGIRLANDGCDVCRALAVVVSVSGAERGVAVAVVPDRPAGEESLAAIIVTEGLAGKLAHNGQLLPAGLTVLHDRDEVVFDGTRVWISSAAEAIATTYDPDSHGAEAYCARTRRRLNAGDAVVVCPGTQGGTCRMLYTADAWALGLRCSFCGFDPQKASAWRPRIKGKEGGWDELLRSSTS